MKEGYREWAPTDDGANLLLRMEERALLPLLAGLEIGAAVDAGCGTGRYVQRLRARGYAVTGVDQSDAMLAVAARSWPTTHFAVADIRRMPLASASSALVVCALVLAHLARTAPALLELARVLAPGGALIVSDLHPLAGALLGWRPGFTRANKERAFITRNS